MGEADLTAIAGDMDVLEVLERDGDLHTIWQLTEEDATGAARKAYDRLCELPLFATLFAKFNDEDEASTSIAGSSELPGSGSNFSSATSKYINDQVLMDEHPFVGRDKEMKEALDFVRARKGLFVLYGSEGMGKSAMLEEIAGELRCEDESAIVLTGSGRFSESSTELFPFREIFAQLLVSVRRREREKERERERERGGKGEKGDQFSIDK